jgi:hypothetical protein
VEIINSLYVRYVWHGHLSAEHFVGMYKMSENLDLLHSAANFRNVVSINLDTG